MQNESIHPTQRIDSTTGRDETVTSICLPPPDPLSGLVTHAYVVGSSEASSRASSQAYIVKIRLDDLSIAWKEHVPSVRPAAGLSSSSSSSGGDVLGEGCAVSPDGTRVFLAGTISGSSAVDGRIIFNGGGADDGTTPRPVGGISDVFVIAFDVDFGNAMWARQLGTVNEDKLARGGGIACDNEGNVIVMGSTRGGLQRPRQDGADPRLPSDVFVMSLSGADGRHVHAPYGGGNGSGSPVAPSSSSAVAPAAGSSSGLSAGAAAGISIAVIIACCALLALGLRRRRSSRYDESGDDVLRSWNSGDDFTFGDRHSTSGGGSKRGGGGSGSMLRIVRGGGNDGDNDDWDDGSESVSRNATWMSQGGGGGGGRRRGGNGDGDALSIASAGSGSSRRSYKSKHQDENSDFIASLRQEAHSTMKKMVRDPSSDGANAAATSDPRLDGGASIKSLLSHYREVKKETLFDDDSSEGSRSAKSRGERGQNDASEGVGKDLANASKRRGPPPPPPSRRKHSNQSSSSGSASSASGLSEFTIM